VRGPGGSALPGIAPSNAYLCSDGGYALIAGQRRQHLQAAS
jgi:formyl-CoA transferase